MAAATCSFLAVWVSSAVFSTTAVWPTDYDPRYVEAVAIASQPLTAADISFNLTTIGLNDHIRNANNEILMTTFTDYTGYSRAYSSVSNRQIFCAVAPEVQNFLIENNIAPGDVSLRTKQLLGLPENHTGYFIVEYWAKTSSLFRAAMNGNITNPVTSLDFVGVMADPNSSERKWFDAWYAKAYDPAQGTPYPWTRAGYTWDWGDNHSHRGLAEFITNNINTAARQDTMTVRDVVTITSYIYYDRTTDSFNVTGWCDTIWMGSYYLPVTPGGNVVHIQPGVTISGGEGITTTDLPAEPSNVTIVNEGTILGHSVTHAGVQRDSSVTFTNTGGTLVNSGVITGDNKGVSGSDACTRPIFITNTGTIRGSLFAIETGAGDDQIVTSGLIDGNIATRKGNDMLTVTGGSITGSIDGGDGTNTMNFNLPSGATFTFNNDIMNMNSVNINSGLVRLNGMCGGQVNVAPGATLGGDCIIAPGLDNWGAVAPGTGIGTIFTIGDYAQHAGSVLSMEVAKDSSGAMFGDLLAATGTATLASGSTIHVSCGPGSGKVFATGDSLPIIVTGGVFLLGAGVIDNGVQLTYDSAFLDITGAAGVHDYTITLHRTATFASAATPGNNTSMAAALDADTPAATGGYAALMNQLLFTNASVFNSSLHQLSPAAYLDVSAASDRTTQYMSEALAGYLRTRRAGQTGPTYSRNSSYQGAIAFAKAVGSPTELAETAKFCANERTIVRDMEPTDRTRSVWVNPFGVFYGERSNGDHLGFQSNVAGVQLGLDKQVSETYVLGMGAGYDNMHIGTSDLYSAGRTDTFRVGPYATWFNDEWYFDSSLTGGFHDNDMGRSVSVGADNYMARGDYFAKDLSLYVDGGYDYRMGNSILSPLVSLQYITYRQDGFAERDADGAALQMNPLDANSLRSRVGGQFLQTCQWRSVKVVPQVFAGWAHEYLQNDVLEARFVGGVTPFLTDRGGIFRDAGYYGLSLTALPRDHTSLFARYNGEYSTGGHFTAVDLGMIVEF